MFITRCKTHSALTSFLTEKYFSDILLEWIQSEVGKDTGQWW